MGKPSRAEYRLNVRVADGEVLTHQVLVAVTAVESAGKKDAHIVVGPFNDARSFPRGLEGFLDPTVALGWRLTCSIGCPDRHSKPLRSPSVAALTLAEAT